MAPGSHKQAEVLEGSSIRPLPINLEETMREAIEKSDKEEK